MKSLLCISSVIVILGVAVQAEATIIDDFSTDSSGAYNTVLQFGSGAASYGRNASNQFQPTGGNGSSTVWLRKDGYTFDANTAISIDVITPQISGLAWSTQVSGVSNTSPNNWGCALFFSSGANTGYFQVEQGGSTLFKSSTYSDINSAVVVKATRTGASSLKYDFIYTNTSNNAVDVTGTITGLSSGGYYFGMFDYTSGGTAIMDNLSLTTIPEPCTFIMMSIGLIGLLAYAWKKRK